MRALATVRRCGDITPIPGADAIETAHVDGWTCVVKKGEFKPGDRGVYFEIDSFLPAEDRRYKFLEKQFITWQDKDDNFAEKRGARLRTIKLRGQLSQGLFLPLSSFPEIAGAPDGCNVTRDLGIRKWEAKIPAELEGSVVGPMPSYIRTTDQERIQNLGSVIGTEIVDQTFEPSVKLDGTSMTVFYKDGYVGVAGRNWEYTRGNYHTLPQFLKRGEWLNAIKALFLFWKYKAKPDNTLWKVALAAELPEALRGMGRNLAIQGELIGEGIQGNPEKVKGQEFHVFDIYDIDTQRYLSPKEREYALDELMTFGAEDFHVVPRLPDIIFPSDTTIESILELADGPGLNTEHREGLVFKRSDGQFSFKAISNWYLLKNGDR